MPRFEHAEGKFWEVHQAEGNVSIRWGKIGKTRQERTLGFGSEETARVEVEQLIAKQLALGYREVLVVAEATKGIDQGERWSRRFEAGDHFVELVLDQRLVQQRHGSLGPEDDDDRVQSAQHASAAEARSVIDAIIDKLGRDGYRLVREGPPPKLGQTRLANNPELEAQCRASPDAAAPWLVYADWLMARGDARGELAALRMHGKETEADTLFKAHKRAWLDDVANAVRILGWRHGFPIAAGLRVKPDDAELVKVTRKFLATPFAGFIESLRFGLAGYSNDNDWAPTLSAVAASPRGPAIRELRFDDYDADDSEISWTPFGDFSALWGKLAALEVLTIRSGAGGTLGAIDLPSLTTFIRQSGGLSGAELASICDAKWPALVHLEVWTGSGNYGAEATVDSMRKILDGKGLPNLRHLGIVNSELVDPLIPALASSKLISQLRTLDLSRGIMAREAAAALVRHAAAFAHLSSIDVTENLFDDDELARVRAALPSIVSSSQRERDGDHDDEDGQDDRYVAVGE